MTYVYFDAASGLSGDMILASLLDLGVDPDRFRAAMAGLRLPVEISVGEDRRGGLRGLRVNVAVRRREPVERRFADVEAVVSGSRLSASVRARATAVFRTLFAAEAKVHGRAFARAHLHEAGADDALVDVCGACWLLEELGVERVYCSPLNVGSGFIESSHGLLPVPPPAVAEILAGVPVYSRGPETELVTPTGAAIVKTVAAAFLRRPELVYDRVGCGAGARDLPGLANLLRAFFGRSEAFDPGKQVVLIEAVIDDATPQVLAHALERLLAEGALDANLSPVVMKKNRLGTKLTVLADGDRRDALVDVVFRETTSIGVRWHPVERRVLDRRRVEVDVAGAAVGIKISSRGGRDLTVQPEFEDCRKAAAATGLPLKDVMRMALSAWDTMSDRKKPGAGRKKKIAKSTSPQGRPSPSSKGRNTKE